MDALEFLKKTKPKILPIYVLVGDENFLKRRVIEYLKPAIIGEGDPAFAVSSYTETPDFSGVRSELETAPFLAARRLVIIEPADGFVTKHRAALEKYVTEPTKTGVLILDVKSWPATTKLAKAIPTGATITCKSPAVYRLPAWCAEWSLTTYGKKLARGAGEALVGLIGAQMGMLDQELDKLSVYVGSRETITTEDVDQLVGRSRGANVFQIMEAVGEGQAVKALRILHESFEEGQDPLAVLGALGSQLRALAKSARLIGQGLPPEEAMDRAGVQKWPKAREGARKQLRHLGRTRLDQLFDWLLDTDLGMKGGSRLSPEMLLERLIIRMARPLE